MNNEDAGNGAGGTAPLPNHQSLQGSESMASSAKRTPSPAFPAYASDFLSDDKVCRMSYTEIGIYWVLLCHAWNTCGLSTDIGQIAKLLKLPRARFSKIWAGVLSECWVERGGRFVNPRQEKERQKQNEYRRRQSDRATHGWQSRKDAAALPRQRQGRHRSGNASLSHSLSQSTQIPKEQESGSARHPVKAFLTLYENLFLALNGQKPIVQNGRDAKIAKRTIDALGEAEAERLLRAFFATDDPFILKAGHGLNVFAGQINKLLETPRERPVTAVSTALSPAMQARMKERES